MLGRRAGIGLGSHDVYANLAGGLSVDEPGLDLPVALALASSLRDRPIAPGTVAIGEVGLLGELRAVVGARAPAARGGPARLPRGRSCRAGRGRLTVARIDGLEVVHAATLDEAIRAALDDRAEARGEAVPAMLG